MCLNIKAGNIKEVSLICMTDSFCFSSYNGDGINCHWKSDDERVSLAEKLIHKWDVTISEGFLWSILSLTITKEKCNAEICVLHVASCMKLSDSTILSQFLMLRVVYENPHLLQNHEVLKVTI